MSSQAQIRRRTVAKGRSGVRGREVQPHEGQAQIRRPGRWRKVARAFEGRRSQPHEQGAESSAATRVEGRAPGDRAAADVGADPRTVARRRARDDARPVGLRRLVERAATDRVQPVLLDDAWTAVNEVFGGTAELPRIDPALTISAARNAVARIVEVAGTGAHVALATSRPASLLTVYLALARLARISGGDVADDDEDSSPLRVDGRAARTSAGSTASRS